LIVSDGEFGVPREIETEIAERKSETNLRVHGLLIGDGSGEAMTTLCDSVQRFSDLLDDGSR
jgi:hypothetical protein